MRSHGGLAEEGKTEPGLDTHSEAAPTSTLLIGDLDEINVPLLLDLR
jgi:hypothetical protein